MDVTTEELERALDELFDYTVEGFLTLELAEILMQKIRHNKMRSELKTYRVMPKVYYRNEMPGGDY